MKCDRCGNAMTHQKFYGFQETFVGWRCIICGEIIDDLILENRRRLRTGQVIRIRHRKRWNV